MSTEVTDQATGEALLDEAKLERAHLQRRLGGRPRDDRVDRAGDR